MPTHRAPTEKKEDRVRLKNLLHQALALLVHRGLRTTEASDLLQPARDLLETDLFWEHTLDGLAVFAARGFFRHYVTPFSLRERVVAGESFYLKPLLPLLHTAGRYFLPALSQKRVALLEGSREGLDELPVPGLPQSLADALALEAYPPEQYVGFHAQSPKAGQRKTIFHGHEEEAQEATRYLHDFCHRVNGKVSSFLHGEQAPLVLAAVEYLHPLYAEANSYPHLLAEGVYGNPEEFNVEELHRRSWSIMQRAAEAELTQALQEYAVRGADPKVSQDPGAVIAAARAGRVERLFVAEGEERWGTLDPATLEVRVHEHPRPEDRELLDEAAVRTLLTGGRVYTVPGDRMPGRAALAALFRY
ncbi:MAG: hypothetical protein ACK44W_00165 [Planctomycetota bacterium]